MVKETCWLTLSSGFRILKDLHHSRHPASGTCQLSGGITFLTRHDTHQIRGSRFGHDLDMVDGKFTVSKVECLGSCGTAPMLQCGASYHENLTYEKVDTLLETYKADDKLRSYTDLDYKNTL